MTPYEQDAARAVFYAALEHITTQGEPSVVEDGSGLKEGSCMYRHPEGLSCAFAPCIDEYSKFMEGDTAEGLLESWSGNLHIWARACPPEFATEVQEAHDISSREYRGVRFMEGFLKAMEAITKKYPELNLEMTQ